MAGGSSAWHRRGEVAGEESFRMVNGKNSSVSDEFDINAPHREAARCYGLFLRGHSAERLRQDIDIPKALPDRWTNHNAYQEGPFQDNVQQMVRYRKQVLAIFDELVSNQRNYPGLQ